MVTNLIKYFNKYQKHLKKIMFRLNLINIYVEVTGTKKNLLFETKEEEYYNPNFMICTIILVRIIQLKM